MQGSMKAKNCDNCKWIIDIKEDKSLLCSRNKPWHGGYWLKNQQSGCDHKIDISDYDDR
jgi:hypothetical protein